MFPKCKHRFDFFHQAQGVTPSIQAQMRWVWLGNQPRPVPGEEKLEVVEMRLAKQNLQIKHRCSLNSQREEDLTNETTLIVLNVVLHLLGYLTLRKVS